MHLGISAAVLCTALAASAILSSGQQQRRPQERQRAQVSALKVGELAPTFNLDSLDGKASTDLKELRGGKPVVLYFGSYTGAGQRSKVSEP